METWEGIKNYLINDIWEPGHGDFWGGLMLAVLTAVFWFFRKRLTHLFNILLRFQERTVFIPKRLRIYKKHLDEETLKLKHSWKLEGQDLSKLIVPVTVFEKKGDDRLNLSQYIQDRFSKEASPRILMTGNAGSGKSVAMGVIARKVWSVDRKNTLVPVLLRFAQIRTVKTERDLEIVITKSLNRFQFEYGKRSLKAEEFVNANLIKGRILLLFDGFDELEKKSRFELAQFLNRFFQTYLDIPFIITCRTAVWTRHSNIFSSLVFEEVSIANFTPLEVRQFLKG